MTLSSVQQAFQPSLTHKNFNVKHGSKSVSLMIYVYNVTMNTGNTKKLTSTTSNLPTAFSILGMKMNQKTCNMMKLLGPYSRLVSYLTPNSLKICCPTYATPRPSYLASLYFSNEIALNLSTSILILKLQVCASNGKYLKSQ